jgi:hypothetical protein
VRALVLQSLKSAIDPAVADDLMRDYEKLVAEYRKGDAEATLNACGKFVEHVLRAIEFLRSGVSPAEIKSVAGTIKEIEKDGTLPESLRILMPRVASAMMFDVRSKRGAAHVKEIDPRHIDAALATQAASWIMSEFVRLYHVGGEREVADTMATLMRGNVPMIEHFGDEMVVTTPLSADMEVLLRVFASEPVGIDRKALGTAVRQQSYTVTKALRRLEAALHIHLTKSGVYRITGPGERALANNLASISGVITSTKQLVSQSKGG